MKGKGKGSFMRGVDSVCGKRSRKEISYAQFFDCDDLSCIEEKRKKKRRVYSDLKVFEKEKQRRVRKREKMGKKRIRRKKKMIRRKKKIKIGLKMPNPF